MLNINEQTIYHTNSVTLTHCDAEQSVFCKSNSDVLNSCENQLGWWWPWVIYCTLGKKTNANTKFQELVSICSTHSLTVSWWREKIILLQVEHHTAGQGMWTVALMLQRYWGIQSIKVNELPRHTLLWLTTEATASVLFYHRVLLHLIHKVVLSRFPIPFRNTCLNSGINSTFIVRK